MLVLFHVAYNFSIWHLRNLTTPGPKIANIPCSKVKLYAHCRHDSVESLISTSDHNNQHAHRATPWIFPPFWRINAHGLSAQLVNPCLIRDVLSLSHHFFGAIHQSVHRFSQPQDCLMNQGSAFVSHHQVVIWKCFWYPHLHSGMLSWCRPEIKSAAWTNSETDLMVAYWYRGGNCNCLLSHHCPLVSHCQQSPRILCTRCVVPLIPDHGVLLIISNSVHKILISNFVLDTSLHHSFQSVIIRS